MTLIVGASAHGSPGVTSALLLASSLWPGDDAVVPVVFEADLSGGILAARYQMTTTPGVATLAESLRKNESPDVLDHAQRLPSGVACVPLAPSAVAAATQLRSAGADLAGWLANAAQPILVDAGRITPGSPIEAVVAKANLLVWFVRPRREELLALRHRMAECVQPEHVGVVLIGKKPYNDDQVAEALGVEVMHTLPHDQRGADALNLGGSDRSLRRSQLARSAATLAELMARRSWVNAVGAADVAGDPFEVTGEIERVATAEVAHNVEISPEHLDAAAAEDADIDLTPAAEPEPVAVWSPASVPVWTPDSTTADGDNAPGVDVADDDEQLVAEPEEPQVAVWTP